MHRHEPHPQPAVGAAARRVLAADALVILVAPNVSEQMGGEAIKALQIFRALRRAHPHTIQITHARNRAELTGRLGMADVHYVEDTPLSVLLWRSVALRWLLDPWFCRKAVRLAERIARERGTPSDRVVIHQTEPNSPVMPRSVSARHANVFGPINGNIYYPAIFRRHERTATRLRRVLHMPLQRLNRRLFRGVARADAVLYAGGERTRRSLDAGGCPPGIMTHTVDCGVDDALLDRPRLRHAGANPRFVHYGRLVFHKGTALIIESLARTQGRVCVDIVGRGPELDRCRQLAQALGLGDRVRFLDWYTRHEDLFDSFAQYRGVLLPSIEDANGIVVQEAMALGLPPVCLDWGGPQLLVQDGRTGFLIEPRSREYITAQMAHCLDALAEDGELAESMSIAAREVASGWRWSTVIGQWAALYPV